MMPERPCREHCKGLLGAGRRSSACCVSGAWRALTQSHQSRGISHHQANPLSGLVADVCQEEANAGCHGKREGPASRAQKSQHGEAHPP